MAINRCTPVEGPRIQTRDMHKGGLERRPSAPDSPSMTLMQFVQISDPKDHTEPAHSRVISATSEA